MTSREEASAAFERVKARRAGAGPKPNGTAAGQAAEPPEPPPEIITFPELSDAAYHGPLGAAVRLIEPQTEASPAGIFLQLLTLYGNALGRTAYYQVEADQHFPNLFVAIVGMTSHGRKGVSLGRSREVMHLVDEMWSSECVTSGLSSGEGLIWQVRDPITKRNKDGEEEVLDPGVEEKRLCVFQAEMASVFQVMARAGNTLSPIVRDAWDRGNLRVMTKNNPTRATGAHISLVGHIGMDELRRHLSEGTELLNGFGNRWLYGLVRRAQLLPFGGEPVHFGKLTEQLQRGLCFARTAHRVRMTEAAKERWSSIYPELTAERAGMLGAATARGAPYVLRVALVFAMADARSAFIDLDHLEAALAVWRFCAASAGEIFAGATGDPVADAILAALKARHPDGMSRTELSNLFGRNLAPGRMAPALDLLLKLGLVERLTLPTRGRPVEMWHWKK